MLLIITVFIDSGCVVAPRTARDEQMPVTTAAGDLKDLIKVDQPAFYDVHNAPLLARLRRGAPVFYYPELNTWVLSKYHDVKYASKTPSLFSVHKGILLNDA